MQQKSLSSLGYIMEYLHIQTVSMSRAIHVDASLVSKLKSGDRTLTPKSMYFDDIVAYIIEQSALTQHIDLKKALNELFPHEKIEDDKKMEGFLRQAISSKNVPKKTNESSFPSKGATCITSLFFEKNSGKRDAFSRLLDYAESMTEPGEFIFIDTDGFNWLIEDEIFAEQFTNRMEKLLLKGFHAKIVLHYSDSNDYSIVNSASIAWESTIRKVPAERKEKSSVKQFLLEMASYLEK